MKIYRIENEETNYGMWYRIDGTYDPFILTLTDGKSKDIPMDYHKRYSKDGLKWFSGCSNVEDMNRWFSVQDAVELFENGYRLYEFEVNQYVVEEFQVLFTRESITNKKEIPLDTIWNIKECISI